MDWLTSDLKLEIRKVFESRYKRVLADEEVVEIAGNLTGFMEVFSKYQLRKGKNDNEATLYHDTNI